MTGSALLVNGLTVSSAFTCVIDTEPATNTADNAPVTIIPICFLIVFFIMAVF